MNNAWTDAPIKSQAEDEFGRAPYATHAAALISRSHTWHDSIVFGLTGAWGSGKTSMLSMIQEELEKSSDWHVARFTPWASSDVGGLLAEFYASLSAALPQHRSRQVREALGSLAEMSSPAFSLIPWVGGVAAKAAEMGGAALRAQKSWDVAFERASLELRKLEARVLVVADDVDRLQTDELLALLKVVRLLGRFPGVNYLLAYDETTLFSVLGNADLVKGDVGAAQQFVEKIVQYPLVVPPLSTRQLLRRVEDGIAELVGTTGSEIGPEIGRLSELGDVFASRLATPRAVDRFLAQLRHHFPLVDAGDIHTEDLVVLTALRVSFPTLYLQLPRWRRELTSGHTDELLEPAQDLRMRPFEIAPLLKLLPEAWHGDAARLLRDLFPALSSPGLDFAPAHRPRGISDERYFDRYFAMSVPAYDISDIEVANLISEVRTGQSRRLEDQLQTGDEERVALILGKILAIVEELRQDDHLRLALLGLIGPQLESWSGEDRPFTSLHGLGIRLSIELLRTLSPEADEVDVITALDAISALADRSLVFYRFSKLGVARQKLWFAPAATYLGTQLANELISHVELQDDAPLESSVGWLITVLSTLDQGPTLGPLITRGIADGHFSLGDVAARFVSVDDSFDEPRIQEMRRDDFLRLIPESDDEWYRAPMESVDTTDVSWSNRRTVAAGRFSLPE